MTLTSLDDTKSRMKSLDTAGVIYVAPKVDSVVIGKGATEAGRGANPSTDVIKEQKKDQIAG